MDRLLNLKYYFAPVPSADFQFTKLTLVIAFVLIIAGFALSVYRNKYSKDKILKKILRPYPTKLITYGVIVLILLLIRETGIPYLSMRFWWLVILVFFLYSLINFLLRFRSRYNSRLTQYEKRVSRNKYLPKKKRK